MKTLAVLFVLTSHATIPETGQPTGLWLEEFTTPYYAMVDAGYEVDVASVKGGAVPIDPKSKPASEKEAEASVARYLKDEKAQQKIAASKPLSSIDGKRYAAVILPGGHGTMFDLPESAKLASLVSETLADNRIVAAICHGPAGLVNAKFADGTPVVKGKRVAAFTNEEEEAVKLTDAMPFLLETRLKELGAKHEEAPNFQPFAVADGNLITGQNPASSHKVAELVIAALKEKK
jgi:putative intracellular protease/amidase